MFHWRSKYIGINFHYIHELLRNVEFVLEFINQKTKLMFLIRSLSEGVFTKLKKMMGMITFKVLNLNEVDGINYLVLILV